jgi:radical SAM protein with 4Fe4S-binding SPASM domain
MLGESGDKTFRMGNLSEDFYEKVMLGDSFLDILESSMSQSAPICSECAFMPYCGADPVYHHETQQDFLGNKALSGYCHRNIGIFRHLIGLMCDSPEDSEILRRWAFPC